MADTLTKPKIQLRSSPSMNGGDKSPLSPSTKLLINHGKPNFTIQRSPKTPQSGNPLSPPVYNNNNNTYKSLNGNGYVNGGSAAAATNGNGHSDEFIVSSTKFNGVIKPSSLVLNAKQQKQSEDNEAAKVVLRRPKIPEPAETREDEDDSVPEFIRRQRRIQERLAKENILDFENRRSGYFTQVMISPSSPNRTSFVETMSSPAIVPSLEIPPPAPVVHKEESIAEEPVAMNGNGVSEDVSAEEEVAKAIEEVNKAVAGEEEDDKETVVVEEEKKEEMAPVVAAAVTMEVLEPEPVVEETKEEVAPVAVAVVTSLEIPNESVQEEPKTVQEEPKSVEEEPKPVEQEPKEAEIAPVAVAAVTSLLVNEETVTGQEEPIKENGLNGHITPEVQQNGHAHEDTVTISHTNGSTDGPSIPAPDPSGQLGVNFEQKTVVSFSKDLGSEPNKYPDTVKVVKDGETTTNAADAELQEMAKLKFDIKADSEDVLVTPVLRAEE